MLVRLSHQKNARLPMDINPSGIVILVNDEQLSNAELPMDITSLGIVMLVNLP